MEIKNIKLTREEKQIIKGSKLLSVSVSGGNIIAAVEPGDDDIELAIVKNEAPEDAKFFATLNEGHMVSHVFIMSESENENE